MTVRRNRDQTIMRPNLVAMFISLMCFHVPASHALDLGAATLVSGENEPFELRLEIVDLGEIDVGDITLRFASEEIYRTFGAQRSPFLDRVSISIAGSGQNAHLALTSPRGPGVMDLRFLLEVTTPTEKVLGEYFISLEPSVLQAEQQVVNTFRAPDGSGFESYRLETLLVVVGDTLWAIASRARPDDRVTIQQTMLSLLALNPAAFKDSNINALLAGQSLRVPSLSQILEVSAPLAMAEVARQNQAYSGVSTGQMVVDSELMELQAVNASLDERISELEDQIAASQAEAAIARTQREGLDARLSELQSDIALAQEGIIARDADLAQIRREILSNTSPQRVNDSNAPVGDTWSLAGVRDFVNSHSLALIGALLIALSFLIIASHLRQPKRIEKHKLGGGRPVAEIEGSIDDSDGSEMSLEDGGAVSLRESQNLAMETRSGPAEDSGPAPAPGLENIVADASPLDFVAASNEQESFGDLGFLSDQEKNDIDSVESVEEIFYLGEEESATKLELAYAYQKMGDLDGAIEILREVIQEGSDEQIKEAEKFIKSLLKTDK